MILITEDSAPEIVRSTAVHAVEKYLERHGYARLSPAYALCDMDGTLYDSMPWHARAWHQMMLQVTGCDIPPVRFLEMEGRTGADTIDILFREYLGRPATPAEQHGHYQIKSALFRQFQAQSGTRVMPGAQDLLRFLRTSGIVPVLVTGSGQSSLLERLNRDFDNAFRADLQVNAHSGTRHGKPAPDPYLLAMDKASATPDCAFVLENAPLGVQSGVAAGVFTVAVRTGPLPAHLLSEAGADIVFDTMPVCHRFFPILLDVMNYINLYTNV